MSACSYQINVCMAVLDHPLPIFSHSTLHTCVEIVVVHVYLKNCIFSIHHITTTICTPLLSSACRVAVCSMTFPYQAPSPLTPPSMTVPTHPVLRPSCTFPSPTSPLSSLVYIEWTRMTMQAAAPVREGTPRMTARWDCSVRSSSCCSLSCQ